MKISKLLNRTNFSILIVYFTLSVCVFAEDKPIDIWNLEKKKPEKALDTNINSENLNNNSQGSIYGMQSDKRIESIKLDQKLNSKTISIAGLYDPEEYGLSIDMWSNSDGLKLKNLFENIGKYNLSKDASDIMNISILTNAYYPEQNITKQEFLKFKSDWLIKDAKIELIE